MSAIIVEAVERSEFGKNASRRLRVQGLIPGVVYGHEAANLKIAVDPKKVIQVLTSDTGRNTIFTLKVAEHSADVLIRDYQLEPVKGTLLHADFQRIAMDEVREFEVPIEVVGQAKGVKSGGVMDVVLRKLALECLPRDVPDHIPVQVADLDIGDTLRVSDLNLTSDKFVLLTEPELVILTIVPPRVEEEAPVSAEEQPAEPEVIRRGKAETEEEAE